MHAIAGGFCLLCRSEATHAGTLQDCPAHACPPMRHSVCAYEAAGSVHAHLPGPMAAMGWGLATPPTSDANGSRSIPASDVLDALRDAGADTGTVALRMGLASADGGFTKCSGDASGVDPPVGGRAGPCCCCCSAFCCAMLRAGLKPSSPDNSSSRSILFWVLFWRALRGGRFWDAPRPRGCTRARGLDRLDQT